MNQGNVIFRISLMNGLITGIIFIIITALIYLLDINMFSIWFMISMFVVNVAIIITAIIITIKKVRESVIDKKLNFGHRFLPGLIVGLTAGWLSGLFSYLLFQIIDPDYMLIQAEGFAETLIGMGLSEDDAFAQVDEIKISLLPIEQLKTNLLKTPAFFIILSLIISAFIKKEKQLPGEFN
jgi:hypothetical protein